MTGEGPTPDHSDSESPGASLPSPVVEPEPDFAIVPYTGEVVQLDDPAACATAVRQIRAFEAQASDVKRLLVDAIVAEAERQGTKTLRLGLEKPVVLADGPGSGVVWDVDALRDGLLDAGLPPDRLDDLITETVSYKVDGNVARQLSGVNDQYARIIESCRQRIDKSWRVS